MTKQAHTPGPWDVQNKGNLYGTSARVEVVEGEVRLLVDRDPKYQPTICKMPDLSDRSYSNARLIAAAPELLEALESIFPWVENLNPSGVTGIRRRQFLEKAKRALAKARGET